VGTVIKFPDEGRIVRFGRAIDESATIIILPVIWIDRYPDRYDGIEPQTQPPAERRSTTGQASLTAVHYPLCGRAPVPTGRTSYCAA
jgi:hypothetical protein